ncbi:hypothetical protein AOLI_G00224000 [Acnodon oligacanthus]
MYDTCLSPKDRTFITKGVLFAVNLTAINSHSGEFHSQLVLTKHGSLSSLAVRDTRVLRVFSGCGLDEEVRIHSAGSLLPHGGATAAAQLPARHGAVSSSQHRRVRALLQCGRSVSLSLFIHRSLPQ